MSIKGRNLRPAHRGYRYQDLATAYLLVHGLVENCDRVIVDRKEVADDHIDDVEVMTQSSRVRRQFKSSDDPDRRLAISDFVGTSSSLRFDRLVLTYVRAISPADEYRLCATWAFPDPGDPLSTLLAPVAASPTISGTQSRHYRLRGESIWPSDGLPIWAPLMPYANPGAEFGRPELLAFCDRFIVEISLPPSSRSLTEPGPLEKAIVLELAERVGIGRYPNHGRTPADVAALAVSLANLARSQAATLTPADVERELAIRTDFGRVAQSFPVDDNLFHDRPDFRRTLFDAALAGKSQLVLGPPGAGKSWELTRLATELTDRGAIVACHYCYLEPGDELVERRVTTDVFFGNLLAELMDAAPELRSAPRATRYAVGLSELEAILSEAVKLGRPVVLIIDGLDHITRVRADSSALGDDDTDIVERLAAVDIPEGVCVIVGSQPGPHLDPLRVRLSGSVTELTVPAWTESDVRGLAYRYGLFVALANVGIDDAGLQNIVATLAQRADGNPLYARYLIRGLISGLRDGSIEHPVDWLSDVPVTAGDVAVYYQHLYRSASRQAQAIADVLGVIDFAVTEAELREILPEFVGSWLPSALGKLTPVLTSAAGQGGIRIFHESFRRFMTAELSRQGRSIAGALDPVITWLNHRGFYEEAKSYRFLLPALRRAGRGSEVLGRVSVSFVSDSVAHGHPADAIQRNLALATNVAASIRDWPALVRCVELHRAAYTCFDGSQNTWDEYWATYLKLFGPAALAERLLFDGRPTQSREGGLIACALVDDAGGTAPWHEYLQMPDEPGEDRLDRFDPAGHTTAGEEISLAVIHGRLRLCEHRRILRGIYRYLRARGDEFRDLYVRRIAARFARMVGPEYMERLANLGNSQAMQRILISPRAAAVLRLGVADEYARRGDFESAESMARLALRGVTSPELAVACTTHGVSLAEAQIPGDPAVVPIAVGPDEYLHDASGVRAWVALVRLRAGDPISGPAVLERERHRVAGVGWYRCWLRFVIELAAIDVEPRNGGNASLGPALRELVHDTHPFRGKPRACDLYCIHGLIAETVAWALSLVRTEAEWRESLEAFSAVSNQTASRLDREDGGPLPTYKLLELLMPYAADPIGGSLVRNAIEQEVEKGESAGTYYSIHAEYATSLAYARKIAGADDTALQAWRKAAIYLTAYGWRKDPTVFEVIDSVPALLNVSRDTALAALADIQPLADTVLAHTDHRTTNRAPNAWFRSLLEVAPTIAVGVLAQTVMAESDGAGGWPVAAAIRDIGEQLKDAADPVLLDSLLSTLRFEVEYQNASEEAAEARLAPVSRLASSDPALVACALRNVAAQVSNDGSLYTDGAVARVQAAAHELGIEVPNTVLGSGSDQQPDEPRWDNPSHDRSGIASSMHVPAFPPSPSFVDLLAALRTVGRTRNRERFAEWEDVVLALRYHICGMVERGEEDDARRLLRFFSRHAEIPLTEHHPIAMLAEALEYAGCMRLSAVAYALGYSRGGMGYLSLGRGDGNRLLERALALDRQVALQVVADEVAYSMRESSFNYGTSRSLVDRIAAAGEADVANSAWHEAFAVISHRLPLRVASGWFARLDVGDLPEFTLDEALVALLLARLNDARLLEKTSTLQGIVRAIMCNPDAVAKPFRWWTKSQPPATSLLLVLDAMWQWEPSGFPISRRISDLLEVNVGSDLWGVRYFSSMLLRRVCGSVRSVTPAGHSLELPDDDCPLTEGHIEALLAVDPGESLERLETIWPGAADRVVRRLHTLLDHGDKDEIKERRGERYRLALGREGKSVPPNPVLMYETELFVRALHLELGQGLAAHLWSTGERTAEKDDEIAALTLPALRVHLAVAASRTVRPVWPKPADLDSGAGEVPALGNNDPLVAGWARLAIWERQYTGNSDRRYQPATEAVTLFAGAVAVPFGFDAALDFPFRKGDAADWWRTEVAQYSLAAHLPVGPIIRLARITDWLGDSFVLIPPIRLRTVAGLVPQAFDPPCVWVDRVGKPAVILRTWRVLNHDTFGVSPIDCYGTDLIARPDILECLQSLCGAPLKEVRVVTRTALGRQPHTASVAVAGESGSVEVANGSSVGSRRTTDTAAGASPPSAT